MADITMTLIGKKRKFKSPVNYKAQAQTPQRSFTVARSTTALKNGIKPIFLLDSDLWNNAGNTTDTVATALFNANTFDWSHPSGTGMIAVNHSGWGSVKNALMNLYGNAKKNTCFVGALLCQITYEKNQDYIVAASPNLLYKTQSSEWLGHSIGNDNAGGQVHAEAFLFNQLKEFFSALTAGKEGDNYTGTPWEDAATGKVAIIPQLFMGGDQAMCDACKGVWIGHPNQNDGVIKTIEAISTKFNVIFNAQCQIG